MPKGIPRDKSVNHAIIHRLQIAHGQLETVIDMVKRGAYCIDVINQSQAVQAALKHADSIIMQNHLKTCVAAEIKKGNTRDVVKEVIDIMNKQVTPTHKCCCKNCSCEHCTCTCSKNKKGQCTCNCKDCICNK
jgi:DNA-binding FrmR family transcriptional regulator